SRTGPADSMAVKVPSGLALTCVSLVMSPSTKTGLPDSLACWEASSSVAAHPASSAEATRPWLGTASNPSVRPRTASEATSSRSSDGAGRATYLPPPWTNQAGWHPTRRRRAPARRCGRAPRSRVTSPYVQLQVASMPALDVLPAEVIKRSPSADCPSRSRWIAFSCRGARLEPCGRCGPTHPGFGSDRGRLRDRRARLCVTGGAKGAAHEPAGHVSQELIHQQLGCVLGLCVPRRRGGLRTPDLGFPRALASGP